MLDLPLFFLEEKYNLKCLLIAAVGGEYGSSQTTSRQKPQMQNIVVK